MRNIILTIALLCSFVANAYEPMIREDRIWEYNLKEWLDPMGDYTRLNPIHFKFEGTETINDKTYHKLISWYPERENQDMRTVALMREANNRVYILIREEPIYLQSSYITSPSSELPLKLEPNENEMLLYDFSNGNRQYWGTNNQNYTDMVVTAMYVKGFGLDCMDALLTLARIYYKDMTLENNGREWKLRKTAFTEEALENMKIDIPDENWGIYRYGELFGYYVEGVGNVGRGLLHRPYINEIDFLAGAGANEYYLHFVRQTDLEGNIIFNAPWIEGSGVEEVEAPGQETDGASYDLSGKRVVNPEPGTIYIHDGKKHIAH